MKRIEGKLKTIDGKGINVIMKSTSGDWAFKCSLELVIATGLGKRI